MKYKFSVGYMYTRKEISAIATARAKECRQYTSVQWKCGFCDHVVESNNTAEKSYCSICDHWMEWSYPALVA